MKILIVEDNAIQALLLQKLVLKIGHSDTALAYTYSSALEKISTFKPDLMLVDINLESDKSGIDLVKQIQSNKKIPVIYVTGNSDNLHRKRAGDTHCAGYLVKPIDITKLKNILSGILVD